MAANDRHDTTRPLDIGEDGTVASRIRELETQGGVVAVALSGGADSTFALRWALARLPSGKIVALHYHHGLRGAPADRDLAHCVATCDSLGVRLVHEIRPAGGAPDENSLRRDRLDFFDRACVEVGASALVQGHHADDVAETLLMRLGRGSGAGGLSAPRPVSSTPAGIPILRPLLHIRKSDIIARLEAAGIGWCHDETNDAPEFATRNRVRREVAPAWSRALPGDAVAGAGRTRALLQEDDEALNGWADRFFSEITADGARSFDLKKADPPVAIIRRVLRRILKTAAPGFSPDASAFDTLLAAIRQGDQGALSLGASGIARFDGKNLSIGSHEVVPPRAEASLPVPGAVFWPDGATLSAGYSPPGTASDTEVFLTLETPALSCAPRLAGERYHPCGAQGSQKLQDAMVNRKIPAARRDGLPVVRNTVGEVVWAPGLLPAEKYRTRAGENRALRLTWTPPGAV